MNQSEEVLFKLIRIALGKECDFLLPNDVNWEEVFDLSLRQEVVNIAYDGLQKLMEAFPEKTFGFDSIEREKLRYKWIGYGLVAEKKYAEYTQTISELSALYSSHDYQILLIKGYGLSLYYPIPVHRPTGDIDIFVTNNNLENAQSEADKIVQTKHGIRVTKSRIGHHSHLSFRGISVENHYEFSNTYYGSTRAKEFEKILQSLSKKDRSKIKILDNCLFLPSPTFNALFLMWHMTSHFCTSKISMRQLCDWKQFLVVEDNNVDWNYVNEVYRDYGMEQFANAVNWVLYSYMGYCRKGWNASQEDIEFGKKIIKDIFSINEYRTRLSRIVRFPLFGWKFKVVYHSHWFYLMLRSVFLHLFHGEDIIEKEIDS